MKYTLDKNILKIEIESIYNDTIQSFFDEYIPSKKIQHLLIQNKWIDLDGNALKRESDIVGLFLNINIYPKTYIKKEVINNKVEIIYEDPFIVVVNKPKGVLVHSDGNEEITLTDLLKANYEEDYYNLQPLHRLDKETCGLVVYSKSMIFQPLFDKLMSEKQIRRNYLAFTSNKCEIDKTYTINKAIGKDRHDANKRVIYKDGQPALTKARCLASKNNISIFRCVLDTGRTHQIRLHLSSIGFPLLNDELYGVESNKLNRMGLCANEIEMYHPINEEHLKLEIDLPNDMTKLYGELL